jgi:hypothetical protein
MIISVIAFPIHEGFHDGICRIHRDCLYGFGVSVGFFKIKIRRKTIINSIKENRKKPEVAPISKATDFRILTFSIG